MELLRISENALKVTLNAEDMTRYEIHPDTLDYGNTETRRAVWSILDEAKHRTGFDAASHRISLDVYLSVDGSLELYVTKIAAKPKSAFRLPAIGGADGGDSEADLGERTLIYRFDSLEDLIRACRSLLQLEGILESLVCLDEQGRYALVLTLFPPEKTPLLPGKDRSPAKEIDPGNKIARLLCEYGTPLPRKGFLWYIQEHGRVLAKQDAVSLFADL